MRLVIVESPNKVKTISQFVPKDVIVKASVGHITRIPDEGLFNMGIDPEHNFAINWKVDPKKEDVVKELKELVKKADEVILATDGDREGEAIAWHLKEQLKIPAKKAKRVIYHEVTKKAVLEAMDNPTKLDNHLVDAAISRAILDKIVGYRCSPIARRKVSCRSVGRCQSAALRLVVEREEEIQAFDSKKYYELWLPFTKNKVDYKAQYKGLLKAKKATTTYEDKQIIEDVVKDCKGKDFVVHSIDNKDRNVSPKEPFITTTLQQEASSKLGYSIKKVTQCAQQLFEGITIGGLHTGLISYPRTDCTDLPDEIIAAAKTILTTEYGNDMFVGPRKGKKVKNAQEGHSAIYAVDLTLTPDKLATYINDQALLNVYKLVYNRTLKACCKDATVSDITFTIACDKHKFIYTEHVIKDKGFYAIDMTDNDDDVAQISADLFVGEKVDVKL